MVGSHRPCCRGPSCSHDTSCTWPCAGASTSASARRSQRTVCGTKPPDGGRRAAGHAHPSSANLIGGRRHRHSRQGPLPRTRVRAKGLLRRRLVWSVASGVRTRISLLGGDWERGQVLTLPSGCASLGRQCLRVVEGAPPVLVPRLGLVRGLGLARQGWTWSRFGFLGLHCRGHLFCGFSFLTKPSIQENSRTRRPRWWIRASV